MGGDDLLYLELSNDFDCTQTYIACKHCHRRWKKPELLNQPNASWLLEHTRDDFRRADNQRSIAAFRNAAEKQKRRAP